MKPVAGFARAPAGEIASRSPATWYQFNAGITITGSGVSQWNDQSVNARPLLQATDANRPTKQANGSILFDGVAQFLRSGAFTINQPGTVYWVAKQVTWTASEKLMDGVTTRWVIQQRSGGVTPQIEIFAGLAVGNNSDLAVGAYGVVAAVYNGASSLLQVNNGTPTTGDAGAGAISGGVTLCADNAGIPTVFANFEVRSGSMFDSSHDAGTRFRVARSMGRICGVIA